jgi:hypothetical protein
VPDGRRDVRAFAREVEERVTGMLDDVRSRVARKDTGEFRKVLRGAPSTRTWWDRARLLEETS